MNSGESVKRSRRSTRFLPPYYSRSPIVREIQVQLDYGPYAKRRYKAIADRNYFKCNRFNYDEGRRMMPFEIRNRRGPYSWRTPEPGDWMAGEGP